MAYACRKRRGRQWFWLAPLVVMGVAGLALGAPRPAHGEAYFSLFAGTAFTESKSNETTLFLNDTPFLDGSFHDVDLHNSPLLGAKLGYFLPRRVLGGHFGTELEVHYTQPNASRQTVEFTGTFLGVPSTFETSIQHVHFEVYSILLSALYRVPLVTSSAYPYGRLQPYVGIGGGAFIATMRTRTTPLDVNRYIHDTDIAPGLQVMGGVKFFLVRNIALFAEYRFAQTSEFTFEFKEEGTVGGFPVTETARDRADLTQHQAAFGIAVHW